MTKTMKKRKYRIMTKEVLNSYHFDIRPEYWIEEHKTVFFFWKDWFTVPGTYTQNHAEVLRYYNILLEAEHIKGPREIKP
jgi:hypothetical protein